MSTSPVGVETRAAWWTAARRVGPVDHLPVTGSNTRTATLAVPSGRKPPATQIRPLWTATATSVSSIGAAATVDHGAVATVEGAVLPSTPQPARTPARSRPERRTRIRMLGGYGKSRPYRPDLWSPRGPYESPARACGKHRPDRVT